MADTTNTGGVTGTVDGLVGKASGWIDKSFEFFGLYTAKYSKYIVYAVLIIALSKIFKIKLNLDTSSKGKGH